MLSSVDAQREVQEHQLRLPVLEPLLEYDNLRVWFAVPGITGGFSYHLEAEGVEAKLVSAYTKPSATSFLAAEVISWRWPDPCAIRLQLSANFGLKECEGHL